MKYKKLKINYPKQSRIPQSQSQLEQQAKEARSAAQQNHNTRRSELQTYEIPEYEQAHFPELEDYAYELTLPDFDYDFSKLWDFEIPETSLGQFKTPQFMRTKKPRLSSNNLGQWKFKRRKPSDPNFNGFKPNDNTIEILNFNGFKFKESQKKYELYKLALKKFKQALRRMYDTMDYFFGNIDLLNFGPGFALPEAESGQEGETRLKKRYELTYQYHPSYQSDNEIWTVDAYSASRGNFRWIKIKATASGDSDIGTDYFDIPTIIHSPVAFDPNIDVPFEVTPALFYQVRRVTPMTPLASPPKWKPSFVNRSISAASEPQATDITVELENNRIKIIEEFPYQTSYSKCNVQRIVDIWVYVNGIRPWYAGDKANEQ